MTTSANLPGSEVTVVTYIGESLDLEAMDNAAKFVTGRVLSVKSTCSALGHCGATAVREQFGDGINLARADFYGVQCNNEQCPNRTD